MYAAGRGAPKDDAETLRYYNLACEAGDAMAKSTLGSRLLMSPQAGPEWDRGLQLLKEAADAEIAQAQFNLANCYFCGKAVAQDYDAAEHYYRKAALGGSQYAQVLYLPEAAHVLRGLTIFFRTGKPRKHVPGRAGRHAGSARGGQVVSACRAP
jgi:TPR repeat protein